MLLEGKRAIVTGGSRGIGRAISLELARQGCDVLVNYHAELDGEVARDAAADEIVVEIGALGRRAVAIEGNIADPEVSKRLVATAIDHFGGIDVLASNAGICPFHTFLDLPAELLRTVMSMQRSVLHHPGRREPDEGSGNGRRHRSKWMRAERAKLSRHAPVAKAIDYMLKRWLVASQHQIAGNNGYGDAVTAPA